jgi:hypothetical protein
LARYFRYNAAKYNFDFEYSSKPSWKTYLSGLNVAKEVKNGTMDYKPEDYIDIQSFIWVLGSKEYPD